MTSSTQPRQFQSFSEVTGFIWAVDTIVLRWNRSVVSAVESPDPALLPLYAVASAPKALASPKLSNTCSNSRAHFVW